MLSRLLLAMGMVGMFAASSAADPWVVYKGGDGPGKGKHVVLISGDEEYRSEEALPQLGKILARHHGFQCTVLFAIDPKTGEINPNVTDNIPGLEALKSADLMVLFTRFRNLPDDQMKHIFDYVQSAKPVVAMRTATHAFSLNKKSAYFDWHWGKDGGFGRKVLGETWISHHGGHGSQSTRGIIDPKAKDHPIVRGIKDGDIWGPTDVYGVRLPLPGDSKPIVLGQVLKGMKSSDPPADKRAVGKAKDKFIDLNDPMMPVAWVKSYTPKGGPEDVKARIFCSTIASSQDMESEGVRRLFVNACYWAMGLEEKIGEKTKVDIVGAFKASPFRNNGFVKGVKPADLKME